MKKKTATITVNKKNRIIPEVFGIEEEYEYTGSSIKPEITVKASSGSITLVKDTDYTVSYGENTELGSGSVKISPVASSEYLFENF